MVHRISLFDDYIAILPLETSSVSQGGILIPETARKKSQRGRVLFAGPGRPKPDGESRWPMPVNPGDIALYMQYAGHEIDSNGHTITVMKASELLGKIEEIDDPALNEIFRPEEEPEDEILDVPEGMEKPACPRCGLELVQEAFSYKYYDKEIQACGCEDCGLIRINEDGTTERIFGRCKSCQKVDVVRATPFALGCQFRVSGCTCQDSRFDQLTREQALPYIRAYDREEVSL
jgi:chaperonin GroES